MNILNVPKLAILKNEDPLDHLLWVKACTGFAKNIEFDVFDITVENWLYEIKSYSPDILLLKPSGRTSLFREVYQERLEILVNELNYRSVPSLNEVKLYENKRFFAYWAQANKVPHPKTWVFYHKKEALTVLNSLGLPLVGKMNIGASGRGVLILRTKNDVKRYINHAFHKGLAAKTGPKMGKGKLIHRAWDKLTHPKHLTNRLKTYREIALDKQKGFIILQQYIPHEYEWRAVRIGESYFAHKKMLVKDKASGSLLKKYENPPMALLEFVYSFTERFGFTSVAVDIFELTHQEFLVNEVQCIFGQSDPYQMLVNGRPGRYLLQKGNWVFEEGDFNTNESFDLRLAHAISLFEKSLN